MFQRMILILSICLLFTGCRSEQRCEKYSSQIFAMDTVMDLSVYASDDSVLTSAGELVEQLERALSVTDPESEIFKLNQTGSADLTEGTAHILKRALEFCEKTNGTLDLSIYPVVRAWGFTSDQHQIPSDAALQRLLQCVDYTQISVSGSHVSLPQGMTIDLGSVAKGFTGDLMIQQLQKSGITSALLNLGGNVQALGTKPDGTPWKVGIQDPLGPDYLGVLSVSDQAVITSGGYERYFEGPDGEIYWHIIDPETGKPARNGLISATAVGAEGSYCDALSTGLFIMGAEKAIAFWEKYQDFQMILVTENQEILITPELEHSFRLTDGDRYTLKVIRND